MAGLLLLTDARGASVEVLPALALLGHRVRVLPADAELLVDPPPYDAVLLDARRDLVGARTLARMLTGSGKPVLGIFTEGGLTAVNAEWAVEDILLEHAGPAEVEARLRLVMTRSDAVEDEADDDGEGPRSALVGVDGAELVAHGAGKVGDLLRAATVHASGPDRQGGDDRDEVRSERECWER